MKLTPKEAMRLAIAEGENGAGFVSPNPKVGCVIVDRDYRLIASGYHAKVGGPHAEINALAALQDPSLLEGAHVFVTLEPCAHQGRTGPCAEALAKLPIHSVTYGLKDPNPLVAGKGAAILERAGKRVHLLTELQDDLEDLAEEFLMNMRSNRPFVAVKIAASLDGRIALHDGSSQWITGEEARQHVHYLRGTYDAVVTGLGTVLKDNPRLDARDPRFASKPQKLVILDPAGEGWKQLERLALWQVRAPEDVIVVTGPGVRGAAAVRHIESPLQAGGFDLSDVLNQLRGLGLHSVFVEAGGATVSSFIAQGLADRLYLFMAPKLIGQGLDWTSGLKFSSLQQVPELHRMRTHVFGPDLLISARFRSRDEHP